MMRAQLALAAALGLAAFGLALLPLARGEAVRIQAAALEFQPDAVIATARLTGARGEAALRALDLPRVLQVAVLDDAGQPGPPMFGRHEIVPPDSVRFVASVGATPGREYLATAELAGQRRTARQRAPELPPGEPATVQRIVPTGDVLPANLLKFYLYFDRPMRQTARIFDQIRLVDAAGQAVYDPWRRLPQWSDDGRRLTLWIHPGRIKQGVNLREEFGPVLQPGRSYTLVIEADVLDEQGRPLGRPFEKRFAAEAEARQRLRLDAWSLTPPRAGTREAIVVRFDRPLDDALARRLLRVEAAGQPVSGEASLSAAETVWSFVPAQPWTAEEHRLEADELLEDLAGNTPARVFDTDLTRPAAGPPVASLPFRPR